MSSILQRAFAVEAAWSIRAAPTSDPLRWRVSPDVWAELVAAAGTGDPKTASPDARLLGEPIQVDDALPPNSMLLEPVSDH